MTAKRKKKNTGRIDWSGVDFSRTTREIANHMKVSYGAVHRAKMVRGFAPVSSYRPWTPGEDALLGTAPDHEVAAMIGRSEGKVGLRRCFLGIQLFKRKWTPEEHALLGTVGDQELAEASGRSEQAVRKRRSLFGIAVAAHSTRRPWSAREHRLLGTDADHVIANRIGRTVGAVRACRAVFGIPAHRETRRKLK